MLKGDRAGSAEALSASNTRRTALIILQRESMIRIIINADDLGKSEQVNGAIFDLIAKNIITSTTILANGPAYEDAIRRIPLYPQCSYGVHLNLTEFKPLTHNNHLTDILADGSFDSNIREKMNINISFQKALYNEWFAQIERLLSDNIQISHIDSHHHIHTSAFIFPILKNIQHSFGIRKVRITRNIYSYQNEPNRRIIMMKRLWNNALKYYYKTYCTSFFTNFLTFIELATNMQLPKHIFNTAIELSVHPGNPANSEETAVLLTQWTSKVGFRLELISYNSL